MSIRCRVLLLLGLSGAILGIFREQETLVVLSLSLLFWIFGCWSLFSIRIALLWPGVALHRTLNGRSAEKVTLWAERTVSVVTRISSKSGRLPALTTLAESFPDILRVESGASSTTVVSACDTVDLVSECRVLAAGQIKFAGVHLRFRDPQRLFVTERFLDQPSVVRSLPSFARVRDTRPSIKRVNSLPQHGIHRLQRAGLGSELLDLREYQSGDPPKSIAWKVSARRDRLMTRQYESEVPVRITLFVDGCSRNRVGNFGTRPIDQLNYMAASVARAAISAGDAVGLVYSTIRGHQRLAPGFGEKAFFRVLDGLAESSDLPPEFSTELQVPFARVLQRAVWMARRHYPELMSPEFNRVPFTWLPILPQRRRVWRSRVRLAGLFGLLDHLSIQQTCQLYYDDRQFARFLFQFLWNHGCAWIPAIESSTDPWNLSESEERSQPANQPAEAGGIRGELTKSVGTARDNEVFVLLLNLFHHPGYVRHFLPAVKLAVARHHRVVILSSHPQPSPDFPDVARVPVEKLDEVQTERQILASARKIEIDRRLSNLKRELRKAGGRVSISSGQNAIALVLAEAELAGRGLTVPGGAR